jgi:hypothetical protein
MAEVVIEMEKVAVLAEYVVIEKSSPGSRRKHKKKTNFEFELY